MMLFTVLLVALVTLTAECIDIQKYSAIPQPVHGFNLNKYSGEWYLYAATEPCSWKGATKFTDWTKNFVVQSSNTLRFTDTYRTYGSCMTIKAKATLVSPGVFVYKDTIGDVFSGQGVVVCVDYDSYAITWGCVDKSADGQKCDDGWIAVKTRHPRPSIRVLSDIDAKLKALWGVSLREIGVIRQTQPCH